MTFEFEISNVSAWEESPQEEKDAFKDSIAAEFALAAGPGVNPSDVRVTIIIQIDTRRRLQSYVVNTGTCLVVVELIPPPIYTADTIDRNLKETLLEVSSGEDSGLQLALGAQASAFAFSAPIVTTTTIQTVPLIANPPPPAPDNITPYTDLSLIFIIGGSCVGLFLLIFIARECDPERIRLGGKLITSVLDGIRGKPPDVSTPEEVVVAVPEPRKKSAGLPK